MAESHIGKMDKIKNIPTEIPRERCIITTSLPIETCISKVEDMAYFDLKVDIRHQSKRKAEVHLMQRRDFDHPIYITLQMTVTEEGTCVTFHADKSPQKTDLLLTSLEAFLALLAILFIGFFIVQSATMKVLDLSFLIQLVLVIFLTEWLHSLQIRHHNTTEIHNFDSDQMTESMLKRAEALKANLIDILSVDPSEARFDELGNIYFIESSNQTLKGQS